MPKKTDLHPETADETDEEKPEPKPGDKDFDWVKEYGGEEVFLYAFQDGTVVGLKPFGAIFSQTWLYKLRKLKTDVDIRNASIDRASCDAAEEVLEALPDDDPDYDPIVDLWEAWTTADTGRGDDDEGLTAGN